MSIVGPQPGTLAAPSLSLSGTGAALNDTPIPATDVSAYRWVSIQTTGTFSATMAWEQSNDGLTWLSLPLFRVDTANYSLVVNTATSGLEYAGALHARFLRVRVTNYISGTPGVSVLLGGVAAPLFVPTALPAPAAWADATAGAPSVPAVEALNSYFNGTTRDRRRTPSVFKDAAAVAVGTIATVWTPAAGKKFRLMGGVISLSAAGNLLFEDNAGGAFVFRVPGLLVNTAFAFTLGGNGFLSAAANNVLKATSSVAANLTGTLYGTEE